MANQHLNIICCGMLTSQSKRFGWYIYEPPEGGLFVLTRDPRTQVPLRLQAQSGAEANGEFWVCDNRVFRVLGADLVSEEVLLLHIQHAALKAKEKLRRIRRDSQAVHNSKQAKNREPIPRDVRLYVWQRDQGKCVQCNSQEKIEYDHIIPISEGGGNTARNIQLLCETCNRQKGKTI